MFITGMGNKPARHQLQTHYVSRKPASPPIAMLQRQGRGKASIGLQPVNVPHR